ncbi:hypothetical protein [Flagellimonas nanhaiensis]|uniref:hypothetical protein n=1 Tax=Flagellimonas nanhaiensis TaxID=2292706 RepID=UPI0015F27ACF|nr:hypothetical protein [Allomuricauda nanhaiensis]
MNRFLPEEVNNHFAPNFFICLAEEFQKKKLVIAKIDSSEKQLAPKLSWNIRPMPILNKTKMVTREMRLAIR